MRKYLTWKLLAVVFIGFISGAPTWALSIEFDCAKAAKTETPKLSRADVYKGLPFAVGEKLRYELRYFGALVGYGFLEVKKPVKWDGAWHRLYHAEAKTGDWYKLIFVAHDKLNAISRPHDFSIRRFYMEQDEGKLFSSRFRQKKWLDFDPQKCKVFERVEVPGKDAAEKDFAYLPGGIDALGAIYKIRSLALEIGKSQKIPVYSSEENWWLEVTPEKEEMIETDAGKFKTLKLKLKTYLGKDLEQKGDLFAWVDIGSAQRPLVKIEGDVKIGRVVLNLVEVK